ncbi:MAG TPA: hypothetical protein VN715_21040 [Roseiarcus sp.]|nr:hypothetical protein [Roseiarcus sp.]
MDVARLYLKLGPTWLVVGMALGIYMGMAKSFELAPLHAHINLVGFACHMLFGLTLRQWPELARSALATAQFWIFALSTPLMVIGLYLTLKGGVELPVILGSLGLFVGAAMFCLIVWRRL